MKTRKIIQFYFYFAVAILGIVIIINSISFGNEELPPDSFINPTVVKNTYQVFMLKNDAIPNDYIEMKKMYVAKLIDYINFNFNMQYNTDAELAYSITGKLEVNYLGNVSANNVSPILTERQYTFVPTKVADSQTINEQLKLKYEDYNYEYAKIKESLGVTVEGNLYIILEVFNNSTSEKIYKEVFSVPLDKEVVTITNQTKESNTSTNTNKENAKIDSTKIIIGIVILLYAGYKAYKIADKAWNIEKENYYTINLSKILKMYGDIIAEMAEPIDLSGIKVSDVRNFDQLIDVEEETRSPINFYEVKKREEGHFVIIHNNIGYRYILKNPSKKK